MQATMQATMRVKAGSVKVTFLAAACLFSLGLLDAGYAIGRSSFGQPKTILHAVSIRWQPGVSEADKHKVLQGVTNIAASIPGVKNVWIKSERVEPRGFDDAFVIDFRDRAAADAYAYSAAHQAWNENYSAMRASSSWRACWAARKPARSVRRWVAGSGAG